MKISCQDTRKVVQKAFYLAYKASQVVGMGHLQAIPNATIEDVWDNVCGRGDYGGKFNTNKPGDVHSDYVFGKMMKLSIKWSENEIEISDNTPNPEYQSWATVYPTYQKLIEAAL